MDMELEKEMGWGQGWDGAGTADGVWMGSGVGWDGSGDGINPRMGWE